MTNRSDVLIGRFSRASGGLAHVLMLLTGGAIALGQAPFDLIGLSFPALCLAIFLGVATSNPKQAARRGWMIGFGFSAVTFSWIVEPFLIDAATHAWIAPFVLLLMAGVGGAFWGAGFWAARRYVGHGVATRALAIAVFLTIGELIRTYALTGFPWALGSYVWIETPVYQWAAVTGPHGLTMVTMVMAATVVAFSLNRRWPGLVVCAVLALFAWFGGIVLRDADTLYQDDSLEQRPIVRLIQPNADQKVKWDPDMIPVFYQRQLDLSAEVANEKPDLVIWPEVAVAFLLNEPAAPLWEISDAAGGVPVILGAQRFVGRRAFNSLAVLGPDGAVEQVYDKHHLVPFGEYLPAEWLLSRIGLKAMTAKYGFGYSAGPGPEVLDLGDLGQVMPLVCYEAIFPHEMRKVAHRPDWMLILTNDAWFGDLIGPFQHLAQAKARAIEFSIPMVRVANTGVSAVFDAKGRMVSSLPLGVAGRLDVRLPRPAAASIYWKFGDIPVFLTLIVLVVGLIWRSNRFGLTQP